MGSPHSRCMQLLAGLCPLTWEQLLPRRKESGWDWGGERGGQAACPITNAERLKPRASEPRALSAFRATTDLAGVQAAEPRSCSPVRGEPGPLLGSRQEEAGPREKEPLCPSSQE